VIVVRVMGWFGTMTTLSLGAFLSTACLVSIGDVQSGPSPSSGGESNGGASGAGGEAGSVSGAIIDVDASGAAPGSCPPEKPQSQSTCDAAVNVKLCLYGYTGCVCLGGQNLWYCSNN